MDGVTVPVAVVASRTEAELIVGLLRSNGLSAAVSADDAGGQEPQLQLEGVRVLVAPADETSARRSWPPPRRRMPIADRMTPRPSPWRTPPRGARPASPERLGVQGHDHLLGGTGGEREATATESGPWPPCRWTVPP